MDERVRLETYRLVLLTHGKGLTREALRAAVEGRAADAELWLAVAEAIAKLDAYIEATMTPAEELH
jgi:hypothetical protein